MNKVPSKKSISDVKIQIDSLNDRLLLLSKELMEINMGLKTELSDLEDNTKGLVNDVNDMAVTMNVEVKKQFEEMYSKVDILNKELKEINQLLDTAKETFLGKYIIK